MSPAPNRGVLKTAAFTTPCDIGEELEILGKRYVVLAQLTRAEYLHDMRMRRALDQARGYPRARRGVYNDSTKQFEPRDEPGPEYVWCYRIEAV